MAKICPVCGGESPDNANFCVKCGTRHEQQKPVEEADIVIPAKPAAVEESNKVEETESSSENEVNGIEATEAALVPPAVTDAEKAYETKDIEAKTDIQPVSQPAVSEAPSAVTEPPVITPAAEYRTSEAGSTDSYENRNPEEATDPIPPKKSRYAPMSSVGTALSLIAMSIPLVGFILMIVWACGGCRKIGRRNLARAGLILLGLGIVLWIAAALVIRYVFAEDITRLVENLFPGYTIIWG